MFWFLFLLVWVGFFVVVFSTPKCLNENCLALILHLQGHFSVLSKKANEDRSYFENTCRKSSRSLHAP